MRAMVAGATGFIGSRLVGALREQGAEVRCLVRDVEAAQRLDQAGCELVRADVTDPRTLEGAGRGIDVAYYLVHLMKGGGDTFDEQERDAAAAFARAAKSDGVERVIYLGGLGDDPRSKHLRSRHATAEALAAEGPPLTYFRAGIVVGAQSASFRLLREVVERVPLFIAPEWLDTRTQPIGVQDVVAYLAQAPGIAASAGREVQIGGPDVVTYSGLLDEMALALGKEPRPKISARGLSPESAGSAAAAVTTSEDDDLVSALVEGLATETVVTDPSGAALFEVEPEPLALVLCKALDEADGVLEGVA